MTPLQGEWLPRLLLRCDATNHWESGVTLTHLFRSIKGSLLRGRKRNPDWIVVPSPALEYLAQVLATPVESLLATTYREELTCLYAPSSPYAAQLRRSSIFHLCPACIAEAQLLRRTLVLPHISFCPYHKVKLMTTRQCGAALQLFSPQAQPFTCPRCRCAWARLPLISAQPEYFEREQRVYSCYGFFFAYGTPQILAQALQIIREKLKQKKSFK